MQIGNIIISPEKDIGYIYFLTLGKLRAMPRTEASELFLGEVI